MPAGLTSSPLKRWRPLSTLLAPAGISSAWPLMLPEHTSAAGPDYFDTNIKAAHQTDIAAHVRPSRQPTGQKACKLIESSARRRTPPPEKPDATTGWHGYKVSVRARAHTGGSQVEIFTSNNTTAAPRKGITCVTLSIRNSELCSYHVYIIELCLLESDTIGILIHCHCLLSLWAHNAIFSLKRKFSYVLIIKIIIKSWVLNYPIYLRYICSTHQINVIQLTEYDLIQYDSQLGHYHCDYYLLFDSTKCFFDLICDRTMQTYYGGKQINEF